MYAAYHVNIAAGDYFSYFSVVLSIMIPYKVSVDLYLTNKAFN